MVVFPLAAFSFNESCGSNRKGNCTADINEAIVAGPGNGIIRGSGIADMEWFSSAIKANKTYLCTVPSVFGYGFQARSSAYGNTPTVIIEHLDQQFRVTATKNGVVGFVIDGSIATGGGVSNGPQVVVICHDVVVGE